jgi:chromosome segregation protein
MTRINKLVLNGFKSFAKFTEIVFGERYNCILGPNGSGKSNVADALCFVLGKTSSKSLRAEKSANLIYNGGKTKKPASKGEVSIYFDNKEKTFPTEETEVKVTRIIKDNGQSIYKINDEVRTRQEIVDLLSLAKIDPDGYNIILQGDIVKFCEMPTIERRMLIEEIAGISIYEDKKQKALAHLQRVDERLKEAEIILSEKKVYLDDLKKDRDQALKFKELSDNVKKYKATLLKLQIDKKDDELSDIKGKIEKNSSLIAEFTEKINKLKEESQKKKDEIEKLTKEIEEKGETEQVNLNKEIENLKIEITKKNSKIESLEKDLKGLLERKSETTALLSKAEERIQGLGKEKESLLALKASKEKEHADLLKKISQFKQKNNIEAQSEIEKRIVEIDHLAEGMDKEIQAMREAQHNLIRQKDGIEHEINTIKSSLSKLEEVEKENRKQLDELKAGREEFKKTTLALNQLLDEDSNIAAKLKEAKAGFALLKEEEAKLNARTASIKEFSRQDEAIKAILERKKSVPGIYGTVSELGTVDAKYSLALEIATGSRIKSIVVDDDKIAAEQIKYLKQSKLGTATFIPLNKIKPNSLKDEAKKLLEAKGCHGAATNLVKFDPKFKKVFSFVFGDTLIVDNIDVARRLGIGVAKMVTLDGDITYDNGAMRGGYIDKKRKGMGFKEAELDKAIEKCAEKILSAEKEALDLEKRRTENETKISELRKKKAELEGQISAQEKSLHLESSDFSLSKKKEDELLQNLKSAEKQINELQQKISEKIRELAKLKTEKSQARMKIGDLRNPELVAEIAAYEEKQSNISKDIAALIPEIKNIEIQTKDIFTPEIEKNRLLLKTLETNESASEKQITAIKKDISEHEKLLKKKEQEAQAFFKKFKEIFSLRQKYNEDISKNETKINEFGGKSREIEIKSNVFSIKDAELSSELALLRQDFAQYEGIKLDSEKNEDQLKYQLQKFEKMQSEIGMVNMRALETYDEAEKIYSQLMEKKGVLSKEKEDVESLMKDIESKKKDLFMKTYESVNREFQRIFLTLSKKGEASLELENQEDPFAEGVNIKVRITGQRFLDIRSLSGGEKTLTALAFIFAIQEHDPATFYILDEVDAALDKHNSEKLSRLIRAYSEKAQYIMISHNDAIISEADNLYGVSMDENGISKVISLKI